MTRKLTMDHLVDLSTVEESHFTEVTCNLTCLELEGTVVSVGQLTHLLTRLMQQGELDGL